MGPDDEEEKLLVPFEACLETFFGVGMVEYKNPSLGYLNPAKVR